MLSISEWVYWILNEEVADEDISHLNEEFKNKWETLAVEWPKM